MAILGSFSRLPIVDISPLGAHLDAREEGEILLPAKQVPEGSYRGTLVNVFCYLDADNRPTATTQTPLANVGELAALTIVGLSRAGAFLDWGMPKDLLLPHQEMDKRGSAALTIGQKILVMVIEAEDGRVAASARLNDFLRDSCEAFKEGDEVSLIVENRTELGFRVAVNNRYWGLVHSSDVFGRLFYGERRTGYIKALRADGKLNISLTAPGFAKVDSLSQAILDKLKKAKAGFLPFNDKSEPEAIYREFGMSKKAFKQSIGTLYKARQIAIEDSGIRLLEATHD